ncbi:hypothetical protein E0W69_015340 [Rhizosphaericola mali]|uniref:Uncharacterized protein n=1 Tax=Rhizosphaericola mali TaxID=2545455 RepID=A0A5P2G2E0_9BACT|nr:hypothetical protein E0W69_015340 [Rhizosphaericola mali]
MVFISRVLYFISHHGFYSTILFILVLLLLSRLLKKVRIFLLIIPLFVFNIFFSQYLNAWFLNKYGVESTAIITSDEETNSTLNDRYIHDYEAIVEKLDGSYTNTSFSTITAAIYPIENAIRIPSVNTHFPVKFIPGYEKNIVILFNLSEDGKWLSRYENQKLIDKATIQYNADSSNPAFIKEYISAMENYMKSYKDSNANYTNKIQQLKRRLAAPQ